MLPDPIKINLRKHVYAHMEYAKQFNLEFWGWSPAWGSRGDEYVAWGIPDLADWGSGYGVTGEITNKGYKPEFSEVTPYSSFLVLGVFDPKEESFKSALKNLMKIKASGYGYNEYGFYDSIDLEHKTSGKYRVSLDEGMNVVGAYNALMHIEGKPGVEYYFWNYFTTEDFQISKNLFNKISQSKFQKLVSCKNNDVSEDLDPNKLVSVETHTVDKGGWGFGLASCVSRDAFLENEGKVWNLKYNIMRDFGGGYIKLQNLKSLDKYNYLVLRVKADSNDTTRGFQVEIKEPGVVFPPVLKHAIKDIPSDRWKEYIIPIDYSVSGSKEGITPSELTIVFDSTTSGSTKGSIYISDIYFYKK